MLLENKTRNKSISLSNSNFEKTSWKTIREINRKNNKKRKADEFKYLRTKNDWIIVLKNISKKYISEGNKITTVFENLNLTIKKGDFVVLFGKSGSGKSTLLNIMSGLDRPTEGHVVVLDKNLPYLSNSELTMFRRKNISFVFQQYYLLNNISGFDNVETGAGLNSKITNEKRDEIKKMFKEFELDTVANKYPYQMSGGQQQRISILRAISKKSEIIFADEPTGALDKKTGLLVLEMLKKINEEQGKTIIVVSHDPDVVKYAKRKIVLNKGKIILDERI